MASHNEFGKEAEEQAVAYLVLNDYTILERNYTYQHAEIDIIAWKNNTLVVVEVKARTSTQYGEPEAFVNTQKMKLLAKAIDNYIQKKDIDAEVRFDFISIVKNQFRNDLNHIEDAFYPF